MYNLTSIKNIEEIIETHIIDSLVATKSIEDKTANITDPNLVDVGSGNGIPGLVWAIFKNKISITLIEKMEKKTVFLRNVIGDLNLKNVRVKQANIYSNYEFPKFDIISSRAFTDPVSFLLSTEKLAKKNSHWLLMTTSKKIKLLTNSFLKKNNFKIDNKINYSEKKINNKLLLWISKNNGI